MALNFVTLFLLLFIPNLIRHSAYWIVYKKTKSLEHIVSFETRKIYKAGKLPWKGAVEELILGLIITFLWFRYPLAAFLAYGWLTDALLDVIYALIFLKSRKTPIMLITKNLKYRFAIREILIPYVIIGPIMAFFAFDIATYALTVFGLNVLNQIIISSN